MWIIHLYLDFEHHTLFKILKFRRLLDVAYCLNKEVYQITNFYHNIKKPDGIFKYITLDRV
jgi:hypothetical protein